MPQGNAMKKHVILSLLAAPVVFSGAAVAQDTALHGLITQHAQANAVPAELVHRIVRRESNYNPRAVGLGGALGLMQIKVATAHAMGYTGPASGLLDADTNLSLGVPYLAGAYRVAAGNHDRAVSFYARGYYYEAKRRGLPTMWARKPGGSARVAQGRQGNSRRANVEARSEAVGHGNR
jgi:soluble lytic murein transglycosylase-like protein